MENENDQSLDRVVKSFGTGAHVVVPLAWLNQPVQVVLKKPMEVNKE